MSDAARARVTITRPVQGNIEILTRDALSFLATLEMRYGPQRRRVLEARHKWQKAFESGEHRYFVVPEEEPKVFRSAHDHADTTIEFLTTISKNALDLAKSSSVDRVIADFEDATVPSFEALLAGQFNLVAYYEEGPESLPELSFRPRGLHLEEPHLLVNGAPMSASFFDVGLVLLHHVQKAKEENSTTPHLPPLVYLPKLENPAEARLWRDIFAFSERYFGLERNTLRAGLYVETLPAILQLDSIIGALEGYLTCLTTGKWDFVFSWLKAHQNDQTFILPDRAVINDESPLMQVYAKHILSLGEKYNLPVTGGVSNTQISSPDEITDNLLAPRLAEAKLGFKGASVAFSELADPVRDVFANSPDTNNNPKDANDLHADPLFQPLTGPFSEASARANLSLSLRYAAAWLDGDGCPIIDGKMVYLAGVEIARAQLWQWIKYGVTMTDSAGEDVICDAEWTKSEIEELAAEFDIAKLVIDLVTSTLTKETLPGSFVDVASSELFKAK